MAILPLLNLAAAGGTALYQGLREDPNKKAYEEMLRQARERRQMSLSQAGEAQAANIRNQTANALAMHADPRFGGAGGGQMRAGQRAAIASRGAGMENQALQEQFRQRRALRGEEDALRMQAEQMRASGQEQRRRAVLGSIMQGVLSSAEMAGQGGAQAAPKQYDAFTYMKQTQNPFKMPGSDQWANPKSFGDYKNWGDAVKYDYLG